MSYSRSRSRSPVSSRSRSRSRSRSQSPGGRASAAAASSTGGGRANGGEEEYAKHPFLRVTMGEATKVGSGMSSYTAYDVVSTAELPGFAAGEHTVVRRYSDFSWLAEELARECPGAVVPPLPVKNATSRFDEAFVARRKNELEKFLYRCACHPLLHSAKALVLFLQSKDKLPWQNKSWGSGLLKKMSKVAGSVSSYVITAAEEPDPWFAEKKDEVEAWGKQLSELAKCANQLLKLRLSMSEAHSEFSAGATAVAQSEANPGLERAFNRLADVADTSNTIYSEQAEGALSQLVVDLEEYERIVAAVKAALAARAQVFGEWAKAKSDLAKKEDNLAKVKANPKKANKVASAKDDLDAAITNEAESKVAFEEITEVVREELARFEGEKILDFRASLVAVVESFIAAESDLIDAWQGLMPDVKAISHD
ncbi:Snx2-prov protein [Thecamonas trahens ATCC 50062]|uniref:Snx2-prov protein n=1 Tax=Thecamonas trahens ATCC 50062 TaxID=461836 RepID=A0A0L0DND0_THETB|nr:Snx2-prov protein [Thecamonas trahens ATCC 50062]KNC53526.1 Snx2-prov protein [Thecamonas trahens ATCC 50062]|eukprot:XP_013761847.1 Snx2-prov protein [Thecamonas trahens ATCC 50062]